ncbi:hypothetical protein J6590_014971 [Homalodisca vitripennis]|nr:hypothetical protein J6590_014971 [Homalodisca vitripennis]
MSRFGATLSPVCLSVTLVFGGLMGDNSRHFHYTQVDGSDVILLTVRVSTADVEHK